MRSRGFSLIEFMIAIAIGLFMIAGLVYLISETSRSRAEIERSSRQIENGRYALDRIAEDLRHAGFYSEYFDLPVSGAWNFPASLTVADPCATSIGAAGTASPLVVPTGLFAGMPLGVQSYDGSNAIPGDLAGLGCSAAGLILANYETGTDILVVRRASTTATAKGGISGSAPYIQTTPLDFKIDKASNVATFTLTNPSANNTATVDAPVRRYLVRIYFVSKCNVPASGSTCNGTTDDGGTSIPTLKMLELGPGAGTDPAFQLLAIAEGIEHLQFDFGIDDNTDGVPDRIEGPGTTGNFSGGSGTAVQDWSNVVTAQVNIVARNTEKSPGYSDDKTYNLGTKGYTAATNDGYRRHAYASTVRLNNVAMRRE
jgi:type IV pilus assembly protein PilW